MHAYSEAAGGEWRRPSLRQRAGVLGLTLLVELAVLLLVLAFGGSRVRELVTAASPISITFLPNPEPTPAPRVQHRANKPAKPTPPKPPQPPRPTPPLPAKARSALPYIPTSKLDLAASDISRLGSAGGAPAASGPSASASAAVGEGPGGVTLYNAEWVREPSDAELRTYLPRGAEAGSWALIACQTIAHYHVENCAQLSESPLGSGLSKAMRQAAWQFLVRPPRIDGKSMVGAWVRIRIDFGKAKDEG